ncbi:hypothetical protein B0H10DRAFT_1971563 [Mycena sp. CBHHK59/15]|nr:hypothetical protein B0H10DRAFT_1971563 [Mycena sp. CBHHK59/15]
MPESRESQATFEIVDAALTTLIQEGVSLRVENIEIDATKKEQKRFPKSHPAKSGLPYAIDTKCTVKRGINEAQGYVYPDMWRTSGKKRSEHSLTELVLKGILYTHRALILDFGALFLMRRGQQEGFARVTCAYGREGPAEGTQVAPPAFGYGGYYDFQPSAMAGKKLGMDRTSQLGIPTLHRDVTDKKLAEAGVAGRQVSGSVNPV